MARAIPCLDYLRHFRFWQQGALGAKKAYDLLVQAESGFMAITGTEDTSVKAGIAIADIAAGMYAYGSIVAALFRRERTKEGCHLEIPMLKALAEWMGYPYYYTQFKAQPKRTDTRHATIAPYGPFVTQDQKTLFIAVQNDREWQRFCDIVMAWPELASNVRFLHNSQRVENRDALEQLVSTRLLLFSEATLIAKLELAQIAYAHLNDVKTALQHPLLAWTTIASSKGHLPALLPLPETEEIAPSLGAIPEIGEHSHEILRKLGYNEKDLAILQQKNIIWVGTWAIILKILPLAKSFITKAAVPSPRPITSGLPC